ncbi:hypothetical protein Vadar_018507 [Vaccinium darrowii]|uniref:Uncharacterized protein n=1 Tax=Vaccinium darrowii TaxID=229202 RepID=A0ACB7YNU7_9ERIC|nr:hypothetical protein Vadar_018507 [Vaccinium darrowii]
MRTASSSLELWSRDEPRFLSRFDMLHIKPENKIVLKVVQVITSAILESVGERLIGLVTSAEEIADLLELDDVTDLVIPRGSSKLSLASFNSNLSTAIAGSHTLPLPKEQQPNLVPASDNQCENGGELNIEDASPRTDTSTDGHADDRNEGSSSLRYDYHLRFYDSWVTGFISCFLANASYALFVWARPIPRPRYFRGVIIKSLVELFTVFSTSGVIYYIAHPWEEKSKIGDLVDNYMVQITSI